MKRTFALAGTYNGFEFGPESKVMKYVDFGAFR